jgi:hypothetical protein
MSQKEKLLAKIRRSHRNVSLSEFESLIKEYGYIEEGAKHPKAIIEFYTLPYKRENPVKACYVVDLLEIIDSL